MILGATSLASTALASSSNASISVAIAEAWTLTDAPTGALTAAATAAEALALSHAQTAALLAAVSAAEAFAATDVQAGILQMPGVALEAFSLVDSQASGGTSATAEVLSLLDAVAGVASLAGTGGETTAFADAAAAALLRSGNVAEALGLQDAPSALVVLGVGVVELVTLVDSSTGNRPAIALPVDRIVRTAYQLRRVYTVSQPRKVTSMGTAQAVPPIDVKESGPLGFDFSAELTVAGANIPNVGSVSFEVDVREGIDPTPLALLTGAPTLANTGTMVVQNITPTRAPVAYAIRCTAVGSDGVPRTAVALLTVQRL